MRRFYVVFALSPLCLMGNPAQPTMTQGTADFRVDEKTLFVTPSQRAIINWESFSIDAQETTHFIQPGIDSAVLNRVTGGHASELLGKLLANGRVYLINEKGIIFGKDSVIRVAEWIASTHDVLDEQFLNGDELLFKGDSTAQIVNLGTIQGTSGNAVLIAHRIQNSGHLEAHGGDAACACGCEVLFKPKSAEPISILVKTSEETLPLLENNGTIQAFKEALNAQPEVLSPVNQGQVTLTAQNGRIYLHSAGALFQEGQLTAETIVLNALNCDHSGTSTSSTIDIHCDHYVATTSSHLSADQIHIFAHDHLFSSGTERAVGGSICLESQKIDLVGAHIDASGPSGGKILIGRDNNSMSMNAKELYVSPFSTIRSDGARSGGQIVLWANDRTVFLGEASMKGVDQDGTMEISTTHIPLLTGNGTTSLSSSISLPDYPSFPFVDPHVGSGTGFGTQIVPLSTGNVVVTKPGDGSNSSGAVYLYNGQTGALISSLYGSSTNDQVSNGGVIVLTNNGNYVVSSPNWNNGSINNAGAVTWGSGSLGVSGTVTSSNSLIGSHASDQVGSSDVIGLSNGNYVVSSPNWSNGSINNAGAVTWGSGSLGVSGTVTSSNSLIGSHASDQVGSSGVTVLSNGYVVASNFWNGGVSNGMGAVTWSSDTSGISGTVSSLNSLVGSTAGDHIGDRGITGLSNGNYVVVSTHWHNAGNADAGAVTWGSGASGISGTISSSNSLVGSHAGDQIGFNNIIELSNGNYVVNSSPWNGGFGAVTWGSGSLGVSGTVSSSNSLVGSQNSDVIGSIGVTGLSNGNYVVISPDWNSEAGAVTWGSGTLGISGTITSSNSLIGVLNYRVGGGGVTELSNGNYVVSSPNWNNSVGAVTWGSGTLGISGIVSSSNSLVGSQGGDFANTNVMEVFNGNYVVISPYWDDGLIGNVGAVTWGSGTLGISGTISSSNSLIGSQPGDFVGDGGVTVLSNGNYVVKSPYWNGGLSNGMGAVTWGSGSSGISGVVSSSNSLIGSQPGDFVGSDGVTGLSNGNYVVVSTNWNSGAGAVTWGGGTLGISGTVSSLNSLVGQSGDSVGSDGVTGLSNGNYVVVSTNWNSGAGAVTWGSGTLGISGAVSSLNSLVGQSGDNVGNGGITLLGSGNYVVISPSWTNSTGAATLGSAMTGISGPVNSINSVIGGSTSSGLGTVVADNVNRTFISPFLSESISGVIRVANDFPVPPPVPPSPSPSPSPFVFQSPRLGASILLNDLFDFLKIQNLDFDQNE